MAEIPDIWSIFRGCRGHEIEAPVLLRLHGELPEAGAPHGGVEVLQQRREMSNVTMGEVMSG